MRSGHQYFDFLPQPREWIVTIHAFCDESGKFHDSRIVTFGGIASPSSEFARSGSFYDDWAYHLRSNGLTYLSAKEAFNHRVPLSEKYPHIGVQNRIDALRPFISTIRKYMKAVLCVSVETDAFKSLPGNQQKALGGDPIFIAFIVMLLGLMRVTATGEFLSFICDDEESTAMPMYKLYRRARRAYPDLKEKIRALSFADDEVLGGLQAADFISGLVRLEAGKQIHGLDYEYGGLLDELIAKPEPHEALLVRGIAVGNRQRLSDLAHILEEQNRDSEQVATLFFEGLK